MGQVYTINATYLGNSVTIKVYAQTKWEAIERAMYQHGLFTAFPDRTMYKTI
jgi:hypothetical protein